MANTNIKCAFIHCMDYRIQKTLDELLESEGVSYAEFDRIALAGGAGAFEGMEEQLALSAELHRPEVAILTIHEECGGGATKEDFPKARGIAERYIEDVRTYFVRLDGTFEKV